MISKNASKILDEVIGSVLIRYRGKLMDGGVDSIRYGYFPVRDDSHVHAYKRYVEQQEQVLLAAEYGEAVEVGPCCQFFYEYESDY